MKKLAIFVEGYTEVIFLKRLLPEICGAHNIIIDHSVIKGGGRSPKKITQVIATKASETERYYVLIYDCMGDKLVAQRIREEHLYLTESGYSKIIGLRDVRPDFTHADIPKLEINLTKYIKTKLIPVEFILSVMETESWFLSEHTHFERIDPALSIQLIKTALGFDPSFDDMQLRLNPKDDLNNCYNLVGKNYIKPNPMTVDALDYPYIYLTLQNKINHLQKLILSIDEFFV